MTEYLNVPLFLFIAYVYFFNFTYGYKWEYAPKEVLKEAYFPYELCILESPELYNTSETPHTQSRCVHLLDKKLKSIPRRCWFGSRQQTADYGMCLNKWWGCQELQNRTGFTKYWSDLPKSKTLHEIDFLASTKLHKFEMVAFAGDSMAVQLTQHLICKILRSKALYLRRIHTDLNIIKNGGNIATVFINDKLNDDTDVAMFKLPSGIGTSHVKGRFAMKGIDKECRGNSTCRSIFASNVIYSSTLKELKLSPKYKNTLHFILFPIINKLEWEYKPFAQAILHGAQQMKSIHSKIVILGPLLQHFPNHPMGLYTDDPYAKNGQPACVPLTTVGFEKQHPDTMKMQQALLDLNPNWKDVIGWVDTAFVSEPWHDLHPELHATGWAVDCTHYSYSPLMFGPLWNRLTDYMKANQSVFRSF